MKTINYVFLFLIMIVSSVLLLDIQTKQLSVMAEKRAEYNNAVDNAVDDAVAGLVQVADINDLQADYTECVQRFFYSLYASFNALDNEVLQQDLQLYTPVCAIAGMDGFFIIYNNTGTDGKLVKAWSGKMPYQRLFSYTDDLGRKRHYTINFTMGNNVSVIVDGDSRIYTGDYRYLQERYKGTDFADKIYSRTIMAKGGTFTAWKKDSIVQALSEQMNFYAARNNAIARGYGISYNFSLPDSSKSDMANSINGITFLALFQGYPYGGGTDNVFNKFCVSGAQLTKSKVFYIRMGTDGRYYYHTMACREDLGVPDSNGIYTTNSGFGYSVTGARSAAATGALPCPYCCY